MFPKDVNDDNIINDTAKRSLTTWTGIRSASLDSVFKELYRSGNIPLSAKLAAQDLICACLQVNPELRPTTLEILAHPFFKIGLDEENSKQHFVGHKWSLDLFTDHLCVAMPSFTPSFIDEIVRSSHQAALLTAAQLLDVDAVELFIELGADLFAVNASGNTSLHLVSPQSQINVKTFKLVKLYSRS